MGRVVVVGNAMLDESLALTALPAPGETVVASGLRRGPGGKGLNQAVAAARAGASVQLCAPLGTDAESEYLEAFLSQVSGLIVSVIRKPVATDRSIILVDARGENVVVSLCGCADQVTAAEAAACTEKTGPDDIVLLQGNLPLAATAAALIAAPARTIFNPAPLRWFVNPLLPFCTVVVVNRIEAERITGLAVPAEAAQALLRAGARSAIVTLGERGCLLAAPAGVTRFPAASVTVVDTTGAGDAFCGTLAASLLAGLDWPDAIGRSQDAAARTVQRQGGL